MEVVIPVRNALPFVQETLTTLYQTVKDVELVLVDDCSDEQVSDWLYRYSKDKGGVTYLRHCQQQWWSKSVNDGIRLCKGDWIAVLNSDLHLREGWLEALQECAKKDVAVIGCVQEDGKGNRCHSGFLGHAQMAPVFSYPNSVDWVTGSVWLLNREAYTMLGPLREDKEGEKDFKHFESDREFCQRAKLAAWKILCSQFTITHYWRQSTDPDMKHT